MLFLRGSGIATSYRKAATTENIPNKDANTEKEPNSSGV
jgi:hypothetical protein